MYFRNNNNNQTYSNPLTIIRENARYEVFRADDNKVAFTNKKPRKDSKYWQYPDYLVWDLKDKSRIYTPVNSKKCNS